MLSAQVIPWSGAGTLGLAVRGQGRHTSASPLTAMPWIAGANTRASGFHSDILSYHTLNQFILYHRKLYFNTQREEGKMIWRFPQVLDTPTGQRELPRLIRVFQSLCRSSVLMIEIGLTTRPGQLGSQSLELLNNPEQRSGPPHVPSVQLAQ